MATVENTLTSIKNQYNLPKKYKDVQKTKDKKLIPFEKLNSTLYKELANCVTFLTNTTRMHAWILALSELSNYPNLSVLSKDTSAPEPDTPPFRSPERTEFEVYRKIEGCTEAENLLYRVTVYITVGKIMIQGKNWKTFRDEHFDTCKSRVDDLIQNGSSFSNSEDEGDIEPLLQAHPSPNNEENPHTVDRPTDVTSESEVFPINSTESSATAVKSDENVVPKEDINKLMDSLSLSEKTNMESQKSVKSLRKQ